MIISILNILLDIRYKKVFSSMLIFSTLLSLVFDFFYNKTIFINCIIGCFFIITIFLVIYFISKGGIGLGDMLYLVFFSSLYGYFFSIMAFLLSFWSAAVILLIPYLLKKIDKKTRIPLVPFLFFGCTVSILIGFIVKYYLI